MPRPFITLSPEQLREVETLAALLSQDQIADYFGICRNTFRAIRTREPEVDAQYKRGKAKAIAHVANGLLQKARAGDTTSAIFYLKTQAGWRETMAPEVQEHQDTGRARDKLQAFLNDIAAKSTRIGTAHILGEPDLEESEMVAMQDVR